MKRKLQWGYSGLQPEYKPLLSSLYKYGKLQTELYWEEHGH